MYQSRQKTDGCWHSSTGVSPRPMLMGAARNALWAFNARVSLTACMSSPAGCHACFADRCGSLAPKGGHGAPAVWLGTEQNVSVCLILRRGLPSGFLCQGAEHSMERGTRGTPFLDQLKSKSRIVIISFVSSLRRNSSST